MFTVKRRIAGVPAGWALSREGLDALRGSGGRAGRKRRSRRSRYGPVVRFNAIRASAPPDPADPLAAELAAIDAALARSDRAVSEAADQHRKARDPLVYNLDWNEDERLGEWLAAVEESG